MVSAPGSLPFVSPESKKTLSAPRAVLEGEVTTGNTNTQRPGLKSVHLTELKAVANDSISLPETQPFISHLALDTQVPTTSQFKRPRLMLSSSINTINTISVSQQSLISFPDLPTTPVPQVPLTPFPDLPTTPVPLLSSVSFPDLPTTPVPQMSLTPFPDLPTTPVPQILLRPVQAIKKTVQYQVEQLKVMNKVQQKQYLFLVSLWVAANIYFWHWWFYSEHFGNPLLYIFMSVALFYEVTILPSFYTFYLGQMRYPKHVTLKHVTNANIVKKVAVISLTVPGAESLEFVERQMRAMKEIKYPHDSWILVDKEHSPEIQALATKLGVYYFSRHDVAFFGEKQVRAWNQQVPPFKAKTKAGNVNSWLYANGANYTHFTQLDIDHLPVPSYLNKVLGFFLDPEVKWVQAPSVYGNLDSWTARGSSEQEFVLQGPLQMGFFGFCRTPFIIGSHCTYDMKAIMEIGGFQPTRAEDHLDTVFLAAKGYKGVFLPEIIAVGDGPENFETYIGQQFAWAFSMIQVLFTYTARCIKHYTPRQALQFLFVQTWYTFWSVSMLLLFILPIIALFTNSSIAHVNYWQFLLHISLLTNIAFIIWLWSHVWHLPEKINLSWRGVVLHVARWPIVLSALIQVLLKVQKPYMITVKGLQHGAKRPFSLMAHIPYFALMGLSLISCWFYLVIFGHSAAQANLLFALQGAVIFLVAYAVSLVKDFTDMAQEGIDLPQYILLRSKPLAMFALFFILIALTGYYCINHILQAIMFS